MSGPLCRFTDDDRGQSEVAGAALLIGLVGTAALITLMLGGAAIDDVRSQTDGQQASTILQELDSRFSSVSASSDAPQTSFDLGDTNPRDFNLRQDGWVNVSVNRNLTCTSNISMSSLAFENDDDVIVGYEGGGVWERHPGGGSSMVTSPSISYRSGTVDIHVVNLTGTVDQSDNQALLQEAESRDATVQASEQVFTGDCGRPDNATVSVRSEFYLAWADYMASEFDVPATTYDHNNTARVFLDQSDLPARVDDTRNNVVNLSGSADYMDNIDIDPGTGEIAVDKDADNVYSVSITPLNHSGLNIGNLTHVEEATNVTRPPLDVMFVFDESGSMAENDGDGVSRAEEAQSAAQGFMGELNESMDRGGVVAFEAGGEYYVTDDGDGHYLSGDFDAVNDTIDRVGHNGGTQSQYGIEYANNVLELGSNNSRDRVMVLLTDGVNNDCQDGSTDPLPETNNDDPTDCISDDDSDNKLSMDRAEEAAENGVTIFTVGYGDDSYIDEGFLESVAAETGGSYHQATNSDELDEVFEEIVQEIAESRVIALSPVSSSFTDSSAGQAYSPQAAGSMDHIASVSVNGDEFANINDPTAGSRFTHSFAISDGDTVEMEAFEFECDQWEGTGRQRTDPDGEDFEVVRCTDIQQDGELPPDLVFTDGDQLVNTSDESMIHENEAWWQGPETETAINASLNSNDEVSVVDRSTRPTVLDLKSNQALVYWDLPDGAESENRLLMLYEIGLAEEDAETSGVINVEVSNIDIG